MKRIVLSRLELRISVIIISLLILNICFYPSAMDNDAWAQGVSHQLGQPVTRNIANVSLQTPTAHNRSLPIVTYNIFPQQQTHNTTTSQQQTQNTTTSQQQTQNTTTSQQQTQNTTTSQQQTQNTTTSQQQTQNT